MSLASRAFIVAAVVLAGVVAAAQPATRTVFVTAVDGKGAPVAELTAADFTVKEDGKLRQIARVEPATTPMQIALMLDDGGVALGAIRQGAGQFVERLQNKAEFALITTGGGRNMTLVESAVDPRIVYAALQKVYAQNSPATNLLDGILEVAQDFDRRHARRPVIVAVANEVEALSHARAETVMEVIQRAGITFYYVGLGAMVTQGTRPAMEGMRPSSSTEAEAAERNTLLGAAPAATGGRGEQALQETRVPILMKQFAEELAGQYAVTYQSDGGPAKLSIQSTRKGVKVRARSHVGG